MMRVKLREAMEAYRLRTGQRLTYARLAEMSGVGEGTLNSIGSRLNYQANLATVEKICRALNLGPGELLELVDDPPKRKRAAGRQRGRG
jgi:DNA-binding Xre family transcriptional regulator